MKKKISKSSRIKSIPKLIVSLAIPQLAGFIGSIFTSPEIGTWYATLARPEFAPPNFVFGPVWTALFLLMGIALYKVWTSENRKTATPLAVFGVQMALNVAWSFLFFGLRNPFYAFVEILVLWVAILATIIAFYKVSRTSAYLLIPYILWVSFAAILNWQIWLLN